jgi:membrane protease YdiL (CAAX protease family)
MPTLVALARSAVAGVLFFGVLMGAAVGSVLLNARLAPGLPLFPLAVVLVVAGGTRWLDRRVPLGLTSGVLPPARNWLLSLAVAVLGVGACVVQGALAGMVREPEPGPPGTGPAFQLAYAVTLSAAPAVLAEVVFRGYLQARWTPLIGPWPAILGVAALNTAAHRWGPELADQWLGYFVALAALGWLRQASGSLWPALGTHLIANVLLALALWRYGPFDQGKLEGLPLIAIGLLTLGAAAAAVALSRPGRQQPAR